MKKKTTHMPHGLAHRLKIKDNINTDYIISGRYKFRIRDPRELAKYVFNDIDPYFSKKVKKGDYLIAGDNFGCGSSREQAPLALKALGIKAVIAKSFARIFYRNSFNVGLMLIECNTQFIDDGDMLELHEAKNVIKNLNKGLNIEIKPLPLIIKKILDDGGVVEHFKKNKGFKIEA